MYNPQVFRIWPSEAEREEALRFEAEEEALLPPPSEVPELPDYSNTAMLDASSFNAATGSYSGLYGQKPVDADTQAALDAIMNKSSNQSSIDFLISAGASEPAKPAYTDVVLPPEQDDIIREANEIYERLMREAAEDEAKKQAEIEEMKKLAEAQFGS